LNLVSDDHDDGDDDIYIRHKVVVLAAGCVSVATGQFEQKWD